MTSSNENWFWLMLLLFSFYSAYIRCKNLKTHLRLRFTFSGTVCKFSLNYHFIPLYSRIIWSIFQKWNISDCCTLKWADAWQDQHSDMCLQFNAQIILFQPFETVRKWLVILSNMAWAFVVYTNGIDLLWYASAYTE